MDRYPVKDPLPFDDDRGEIIQPDEVPGEGVDDEEPEPEPSE
jgi:hypothetical protein